MGRNRKTSKVWMALMDRPNEWTDVLDVAARANLTSHEVGAILVSLPPKYITLNRPGGSSLSQVKLTMTAMEMDEMRYKVRKDFFGLTDEVLDLVRDSCVRDGWCTLRDISRCTGLDTRQIARALSAIPEVVSRDQDGHKIYHLMRCEDV